MRNRGKEEMRAQVLERELRSAGKDVKAIYVGPTAYRIEPGSMVFRNAFVSWTPKDGTERLSFRLSEVSGFMATTKEQP